jgi:Lrp/AsnC family transcriptional regulator, regulator for asnA, asnC and gidA
MNKKPDKNALTNKLIDLLLFNSKTPYREIAKKLGVSIGTVTNKIKELEKQGIIKKHTIRVDYEKLGYSFEVLIFIKLKKAEFGRLNSTYLKNPHVFIIYDVTGNFDAVISAKFRTRRELDDFIKKLQAQEYIDYTVTNLILNINREEEII